MKKIFSVLRQKIKLFSFLSIIALVVFVNIVRVNADFMSEDSVSNRKERQLLEKIDIIKEAFPNQIDKEALYATLAHRGTFTDYVNDSYDENFDSKAYAENWSNFGSDINSIFDNPFGFIDIPALIQLFLNSVGSAVECGLEAIMGTNENGEEVIVGTDRSNADVPCMVRKILEKYTQQLTHTSEENVTSQIQQPRSVDLLVAATIVMLDSSSWIGNYSDDNYKQALAGNGLVGNMFDGSDLIQSIAATVFNGVFCGAYFIADVATDGAAVDIALTGFNPSSSFTENKNFGLAGSSAEEKLSRYYTMARICSLGYIGGTYDSVFNPDLSTDKGKELYQRKKDVLAEQIINLAQYYRGEGSSSLDVCAYYGASGSFDNWKQTDERWKDVPVGPSTLGAIGCTTTSLAIQIARSGTQISSLPEGYSEFNPGALAESVVYDSGGSLFWDVSSIAPNVKFQPTQSFNSSNESEIANKISEVLSTAVEGKYQPFVLLQMYHNGGQHWVAVQGVENGKLVINDPGREGTSLSENYSGETWHVAAYKVLYATDVPFGSSGSSNSGGSYSDACGTGEIVIPEEFGNGGYTVTFYLNSDNSWNWSPDSNQGNLYYNYWLPSGAKFENGIAVYEGRYLIACTETFGKVGDKIDFFLDDGTRIPCIIADAKRVTPNENSNEWGHNQGQNVIEFEVSRDYYERYGNPGSANWFPEWAGKRVASATNLGENVLGI